MASSTSRGARWHGELATASGRPLDLSLILRGLFATLVVWWHSGGQYAEPSLLSCLNTPGRVSVWVFFGLSGYVIGFGFFSGRHSTKAVTVFYVRRLARILPLFFLCTFATIFVADALGASLPVTWGDVLTSLFILRWQHTDYAVGVFWTLGLELQFYLVAPLLIVLLDRGRLWWILLPAAWAALLILYGGVADDRSTLGNMLHFIAGMLVARMACTQIPLMRGTRTASTLLLAAAGVLCICIANWLYANGAFWVYRGALLVDAGTALLLIAHRRIEVSGALAGLITKVLMLVGVLAYGIYAWHGVLLELSDWLETNFLPLYAISLVLAWFSFVFVERRAMTWSADVADQLRNAVVPKQ